MWRCSAGAAVLAAALGAITPASAAASHQRDQRAVTLWRSGSVSLSWHGDRARGCAEAGLCGYSGAVGVRPNGEDSYGFSLGDEPGIYGVGAGLGSLDDRNGVVRVRREEPGGAKGGCVDAHNEADGFFLDVEEVESERLRVALKVQGPMAGRCAGPRIDEPIAGLPTATVPVPRKGATRIVKLRGRAPYATGRFSGNVAWNLRVRIKRGFTDPFFPEIPRAAKEPRAAPERTVELNARYRITGFNGSSGAAFSGLPEPACQVVDACGTSGSATWSTTDGIGGFVIQAYAPAAPSDRGVRGAVAAVTRGEPFSAIADGALRAGTQGTVVAELRREGGTTCRDAAITPPPGLEARLEGRRVLVGFDSGREDTIVPALRSGCPGPARYDLFGRRDAATGNFPIAWLARRKSFPLRLDGGGTFAGIGYAGIHETHVDMRLERVSIKATYRREHGL